MIYGNMKCLINSNIAVLKIKMMKNRDWHNVFPDIMDEKNGYRHR